MGTSFEYSKTLAGEGSILLILGIVPYVGWILGIIGIILFLKGIKELANYYQDNEIYQNSLTGVKYYIIALVAAAVASAALIVGLASIISIAGFAGFGTVGFAVGITVFIVGSSRCFHILFTCSIALKKNLRYACTEIRRTLVWHRWYLYFGGEPY